MFCLYEQKVSVPMLSIEQCRAIIKTDLPDTEIEAVRDALYVFAHKLVDEVLPLEEGTPSGVLPQARFAIAPIARHNTH